MFQILKQVFVHLKFNFNGSHVFLFSKYDDFMTGAYHFILSVLKYSVTVRERKCITYSRENSGAYKVEA